MYIHSYKLLNDLPPEAGLWVYAKHELGILTDIFAFLKKMQLDIGNEPYPSQR